MSNNNLELEKNKIKDFLRKIKKDKENNNFEQDDFENVALKNKGILQNENIVSKEDIEKENLTQMQNYEQKETQKENEIVVQVVTNESENLTFENPAEATDIINDVPANFNEQKNIKESKRTKKERIIKEKRAKKEKKHAKNAEKRKIKEEKALEQKKRKSLLHREKKLKKQKQLELAQIRDSWYKLDNSALIYPAICSEDWNSVFRVSAVMKEVVNPEKLQEALDLTIDRFPLFNVSLREGLFWPFFQSLTEKPKIEQECESPCRPFTFRRNSHILRVLYYNTKISFEIFHSLSDGYGALQFFNVLIITYLELMGIEIPDKAKFGYNAYDKPTSEECEDSFKRYAQKNTIRSRKEKKGYPVTGEVIGDDSLRVFNCNVSVKQIKEIAKGYGATINEFLSAVYLMSLLENKNQYGKGCNKPVKLSVPVNIRGHLKSRTMRNFALVLNLEVPCDKEDINFEDMIKLVKEQMAQLDEEYVLGFIGRNVQSERNFIVRILPLFIKKPIMKLIYSQVGESLFTSTLSNVGLNKLPQTVIDNVESYSCVLGATKLNKINLTACSIGDNLCITLSSRLKENTLAKEFFKRLASFGIEINLQSNF